MSSWRLNGSSRLRSWGLSLFLLLGLLTGGRIGTAQEAEALEESQLKGTSFLRLTLIGVNSYSDFQEIRSELAKIEGVSKISLDSEAPGLITLAFRYSAESGGAVSKLSLIAPEKYSVSQKSLPSGLIEIVVSRKIS